MKSTGNTAHKWGRSRIKGRAKFVPLVDVAVSSDPDDPANLIAKILLVDDGGDKRAAELCLKDMEASFIGHPYSRWCQLYLNLDDAGEFIAAAIEAKGEGVKVPEIKLHVPGRDSFNLGPGTLFFEPHDDSE